MVDREKVIEGLEHCLDYYDPQCEKCPYQATEEEKKHVDWDCHKDNLQRDALELLKSKESEWLEDSDPGQEYGTTWACRRCMHSIHKPYIWNPYDSGYKYCPHCGAEMKVKLDAEAD